MNVGMLHFMFKKTIVIKTSRKNVPLLTADLGTSCEMCEPCATCSPPCEPCDMEVILPGDFS